ncbi:MAG: fibrobacter succinogenes major paralogous domain-containing protein [Candidatus Fibromonas sp.]|jgi:uncharacterized protein (TIGR02145 family)|nr:fibrobacter succinogenes major paralogous domain-containing protein [Candidatus Fibromonas sp.]
MKKSLLFLLFAAVSICGQGSFNDPRDGKKYKTTKIGTQTWMAENLNYNASGSRCYGNDENNCQKYGRLYDWNTALKACPSGWHLPSKDEWQELVDFAGGGELAGTYLKTKSGWNDNKGVSGNGMDSYGFSALPGGFGNSDGSFYGVGDYGDWWSASENNSNYAYLRYMGYHSDYALWDDSDEGCLFSVRCVQD